MKTIAAVSTPSGKGGIAVIRVSGTDAISITDSIFRGGRLSEAPSHTVHYGHITDKDGRDIDEVLVTVMHAPKTYTREDVTEISTHGGIIASRRVMHALIAAGAYPAEPGEFTKRAFLNGRIDLTQAEGVIDIINSETAAAQKNALSQAEGTLSRGINEIRTALVSLSAAMQVAIDYPDEDLEDVTPVDIENTLRECLEKVSRLIDGSENGRILREGIKTAIIGKPNVGKSSLLNCLAHEERAIVTDVAGTTRDIIEELVSLDGIPLKLMDTAGIHETCDTVEKIGVERSKKAVREADLVILMLDASRPADDGDRELEELTKNCRRIIAVNKIDTLGMSADRLKAYCTGFLKDCGAEDCHDSVEISAKTGSGTDGLIRKIRSLYNLGEIGTGECCVITNMRHLAALKSCAAALNRALSSLGSGMPQDIAALDIYEAADRLGEITGDTVSDDIVTEIFHNFCVGK